jgi:bifunctional UDP-N-acetylglucosamine pyrophosphorylase/glucosamine-1-phosphate N-acetyltransferase
MKSEVPKVLHKVAGVSLLSHLLCTATQSDVDKICVVIRSGDQAVSDSVEDCSDIFFFEQPDQLGTAHAVLAARDLLKEELDDVVIIFGDTPLIERSDIIELRATLENGADLVLMGFHTDNPRGYGRLLFREGRIKAIIEEEDASDEQKKINFCNAGMIAIKREHLLFLLEKVKNKNRKHEYYLTDIVKLADACGLDIRVLRVEREKYIGINNRVDLAKVEEVWQRKKRHELMLNGVTLQAPESVFFSYDTEIAADVLIEPHVFFGPGVKIDSGTIIHAFSYIEGAVISANTRIGPYARLRSGTQLHPAVKVGNFCEIKKASVGFETKINHNSYIGDAEIGANVNIGAGTVICNYDAYHKHRTTIADGAFIGSNTSLVAPISVGRDSYIASGSVITENVSENTLAFGRARQVNKYEYAKKIRNRLASLEESDG